MTTESVEILFDMVWHDGMMRRRNPLDAIFHGMI